MKALLFPLALAAVSLSSLSIASAGPRDEAVNGDREALRDSELWIYNDLGRAIGASKESGKPIFLVYRCIP